MESVLFEEHLVRTPIGLGADPPAWPIKKKTLEQVGGLEHECYFPFHIWNVILPIDELHHFSRWLKPPSRNMIGWYCYWLKILLNMVDLPDFVGWLMSNHSWAPLCKKKKLMEMTMKNEMEEHINVEYSPIDYDWLMKKWHCCCQKKMIHSANGPLTSWIPFDSSKHRGENPFCSQLSQVNSAIFGRSVTNCFYCFLLSLATSLAVDNPGYGMTPTSLFTKLDRSVCLVSIVAQGAELVNRQ